MDQGPDLKNLLDSWPYDPEKTVRVVETADGRRVIQVRTPFGFEQYEMDGRPDGQRPHGKDSLLTYHLQRLAEAERNGAADGFELSHRDCLELFEEAVMYYYRYLHLFELQDWKRTVRDTARNIKLFDLAKRHAARSEDRRYLEQWRPYITRMNAVALAMIALSHQRYDEALKVVDDAIEGIESMPKVDLSSFEYEYQRSLSSLRELADQIRKNRPLSERDQLERQLDAAVRREDFERAAALRDRILALKDEPAGSADTDACHAARP